MHFSGDSGQFNFWVNLSKKREFRRELAVRRHLEQRQPRTQMKPTRARIFRCRVPVTLNLAKVELQFLHFCGYKKKATFHFNSASGNTDEGGVGACLIFIMSYRNLEHLAKVSQNQKTFDFGK